jgi:peptidoglycan/LPS O-acetylase OafA/YrhL
VASCVFSCAAYLTASKAVFSRKTAVWDFIAADSFTIYLIHFVFITWAQYILLDYALPALLKFLIVTLCSVALSFLVSRILHGSRIISRYLLQGTRTARMLCWKSRIKLPNFL